MKQRLGDDSSIEVWTGKEAANASVRQQQGYAFILWDHARSDAIALSEEEFIILKMMLLDHSAELKRELLRFVHFIESMGVLPAQQASVLSGGEMRGRLIQYYQSFEQLVDMAIEYDQVDWYKLAQDSERS